LGYILGDFFTSASGHPALLRPFCVSAFIVIKSTSFLLETSHNSADIYGRVARWHIFEPKIHFWVNFECLAIEDIGLCILWQIGLFYDHLVFLRPLGIFYGYLVYFPLFGMFYQDKSGNPDLWSRAESHKTSVD
jgi:hypothetical protein